MKITKILYYYEKCPFFALPLLDLFLNSSTTFFVGFFQTRYFVTFMLFLGMANAYIMRTNMSVAIVAMVNHGAMNDGHGDTIDDECPDLNLTEEVGIQ